MLRYSRISSIVLSIMLLACIGYAALVPSAHAQPAASPTPTSDSDSQPLTLIWQSGNQPDDILMNDITVAVDDQGNAYVSEYEGGGNRVKKFDANGKFVTQWGGSGKGEGQFNGQLGIAVDSQGNVYIADFNNTRIQKFDSNGKFLLQWPTEPPVGPVAISVDKQDNVYVVPHRKHDHYLQKFDSMGNLLGQWLSTGSGDGQIGAGSNTGPEGDGIAVDNDGNVYIADKVNNRVQKFDSNGAFLAKWDTVGKTGHGEFFDPNALAVDDQGNLYVIDDFFLQKFDSNGNFITQWAQTVGGDLEGLGSVEVDGRGDLYILCLGDVTFAATGKTRRIDVLKKFRQPTP